MKILGQQQKYAPKKMKTMAGRQNDNDPQSLRPSKLSHHAPSTPKRQVSSSTFKKEYDVNDAAARTSALVLGFPPILAGA
jgi:hypothetical protein